jgi:hypothetical protein
MPGCAAIYAFVAGQQVRPSVLQRRSWMIGSALVVEIPVVHRFALLLLPYGRPEAARPGMQCPD